MKAGDVMTTGAATVRPEASLTDAARLLIEHRISGLPVVSGEGELIGVVTEHDFLRRENGQRPRWLDVLLSDAAGQITARELQSRRVEDVMSRNLLTVEVETPIEAVVELMERHNVKRLPVMRKGKVVGIVSRADLLRAIMRKADSASSSRA
jgi:CBS domain-containing protein